MEVSDTLVLRTHDEAAHSGVEQTQQMQLLQAAAGLAGAGRPGHEHLRVAAFEEVFRRAAWPVDVLDDGGGHQSAPMAVGSLMRPWWLRTG